jgi:hypothetical protein
MQSDSKPTIAAAAAHCISILNLLLARQPGRQSGRKEGRQEAGAKPISELTFNLRPGLAAAKVE